MPLTTPELVQSIIQWDQTTDLTPFIDTADNLVIRVCTDPDYVTADLELIERWLAAFFYHVYKPRFISKRTGASSGTYEGMNKSDQGFGANFYGQTAMRLDTAGGLARLDASAKKGAIWKKIEMFSMTYYNGPIPSNFMYVFPWWWLFTE